MGRHRLYFRGLETGYRGGPRGWDPYHCEWGVIVGDRVRRLRKARELTLWQLAELVDRPYGGSYHGGYFSRLERGWASAPLYVYLAVADVFEVAAGRLLGPDDAQRDLTDAEMTMVKFVRRLGIEPDEAIARIAGVEGVVPAGGPPDRASREAHT